MKETDFARHVTCFLSKYLPGQRNLSVNTIASYRDAFKLFLAFCEVEKKKKVDRLKLADISRELVVEYLVWLERHRYCSLSTRNQRLAAFRSFFHYVSMSAPETMLVCQKILNIPMKKNARPSMSYFSPEGLHLLLEQPDTSTRQGRRDHALLVFLYDSAARVQELRQGAGREVGHLRGAAAGAGARVRLHGRRDRPVSEPRGHPRHVPLVRRHRRPHDPRHPREARLQGAVGQLRQGVDRLAAQGRRERRCHHQQRVRAREAQRHQDVEAGGQGERRGGAPSGEA